VVRVWDLRKFNSKTKKKSTPVASYNGGRSINSAFFSPSGSHVVSTTQANKLDLLENLHTAKGTQQPIKSIRHDNMTGRWLTTFMAKWHPSLDIFCVGSMQRPRAMEVFSAAGDKHAVTGEALTAVASRCCFHPSQEQLIVVGGNSSGRVTVVR
jgi:WD40 repeat protein